MFIGAAWPFAFWPRKVRYKKRRKTRKAPENTGYRENRTYHHFEKYLEEYPDTNVVELDVVEGAGGKSEKVLLTMLFRNCNLMLIFLLEADNRKNIREVFLWLYEQLGADLYHKLFPVILTDNGSSFKDPEIFERPGDTARLSRVFYCVGIFVVRYAFSEFVRCYNRIVNSGFFAYNIFECEGCSG